ncbi:hypothetical protein OBBRIDRAFT_96104 [Obba rivulosa]|uniref:F-box domain-containing protein n=1 Tax=Obba rivulosa TaxID=1052685 RepID=A0A8E2AQ13_9APHY|nr:hypothetical protein OBBRIDRAFT_96104 [Obba rivulosa]
MRYVSSVGDGCGTGRDAISTGGGSASTGAWDQGANEPLEGIPGHASQQLSVMDEAQLFQDHHTFHDPMVGVGLDGNESPKATKEVTFDTENHSQCRSPDTDMMMVDSDRPGTVDGGMLHAGRKFEDDCYPIQPRRLLLPLRLPEDIWWLVLEAIDDYRTLLACRKVCAVLRGMVAKMLFVDHLIMKDANVLSWLLRQLRKCPLLGHHIGSIVTTPILLPIAAVQLAGKLHRNLNLTVEGGTADPPSPTMRFPWALPSQSRLALLGFRTVKWLSLTWVQFSTFSEFIHFVCAFPILSHLTMYCVSHKQGGAFNLKDVPLVKSLSMKSLKIQDKRHDLSTFTYLVTAPRLSQTLTELELEITDAQLGEIIHSARNHLIKHLTSLEALSLDISNVSPSDPGRMLNAFLSRTPPNQLSRLTINLSYGWDPRDADAQIESSQKCLVTLDKTLDSAQFSLLEAADITLWDISRPNVEHISKVRPPPFPLSRTRNILRFGVCGPFMGRKPIIIVDREKDEWNS